MPLSADRPVFDVVAEGLGSLSELVADVSPHGRARSRRTRRRHCSKRSDGCSTSSKSRTGWSIEQRVELVLAKLEPAGRRRREHAVGRMAAADAARSRAGGGARSPGARRADQPPRHRSDHLARDDSSPSTPGAVVFVTHDRAFLQRARHAHRRDRSRQAVVVAGRLRDVPAPERGVAGQRSRPAGEVRQAPGRRRGVAAPGNQGAADAERRARARADGDARRARGAARADGVGAPADRAGRRVGPARLRGQGRQQGLWRRRPSSADSPRASCAAIGSGSSGQTVSARRRCCGCCSGRSSRTKGKCGAAPTFRWRTTISSANSSIPSGRYSRRSATATTG